MLKYACLLATAAALRPSAPVGTRSGFGGRRLQADLSQLRDASFEKTTSAKMTTSMPPFLKKLGIEKPEDAVQMLKDKAADLDVSSATAFAEKNLDIVKAKQSAALVDVAAAGRRRRRPHRHAPDAEDFQPAHGRLRRPPPRHLHRRRPRRQALPRLEQDARRRRPHERERRLAQVARVLGSGAQAARVII